MGREEPRRPWDVERAGIIPEARENGGGSSSRGALILRAPINWKMWGGDICVSAESRLTNSYVQAAEPQEVPPRRALRRGLQRLWRLHHALLRPLPAAAVGLAGVRFSILTPSGLFFPCTVRGGGGGGGGRLS